VTQYILATMKKSSGYIYY